MTPYFRAQLGLDAEMSEQDRADLDLIRYGQSFMVDGMRIDPTRVQMRTISMTTTRDPALALAYDLNHVRRKHGAITIEFVVKHPDGACLSGQVGGRNTISRID